MRAVLLVLALVLAGCATPGALDSASSPPEAATVDPFGGFPDPLVIGHDHGDVAAHKLATPNFKELGHAALDAAAFAEADLMGEDRLVVAALLEGFYILDISDRANPKVMSFTRDPGYIADVKAYGKFVFVGIQLAGGFTGVHVFNAIAPQAPLLVGEFPMVGGCHMLAVHLGYLYCAPNDASVRIFQMVETIAAIELVPVGAYAPKGAPALPIVAQQEPNDFTHDMTVMLDPVTGKSVMVVSFWDYGVRVVDVSTPANPQELGVWNGEGSDESYSGHVHTSVVGMVGGKRVIVTVPENAPIPSLTVIDATDYGNMTALGAWVPKLDYGQESVSTFSTHNFQFLDERVYLAMYHGGVWVLDVSDPARIVPLGYALPASDGGSNVASPLPLLGSASPNVWDVVLNDGYVYATDISTGLHVLQLDGDAGVAALTSTA